MCTCFSSSCQNAFSCHRETVATWALSSWEQHRGGRDLGREASAESKVLHWKMTLYGRSRVSPRPWQELEQFKTFQLLCHTYFMATVITTAFFFSFSLQHRTPLTLTSWALCRLYVLSVIDVCGSSDSHWWKLCGCVMSGLFSLSTFQFGISENWCQICVVCHPPPSPFVWQRPCHSAEVCERRAGLYSKCHQTL